MCTMFSQGLVTGPIIRNLGETQYGEKSRTRKGRPRFARPSLAAQLLLLSLTQQAGHFSKQGFSLRIQYPAKSFPSVLRGSKV